MNPERINRRQFLQSLAAGLVIVSAGCDGKIIETDPDSHVIYPDNILRPGDVATAGTKIYLLRNNKLYPIPDLDRYKAYSKLEQYGRKVMSVPDILNHYPLGVTPPVENIGTVDPFTGRLLDQQAFGGEITIFCGGFMTDEGIPYEYIHPEKDTFRVIRENLSTYLFFTYGEEGFNTYPVKHTARDPRENIRHSLKFFEVVKQLFPLSQFNPVGHSLGTIFALEGTRQNVDAVNRLALINGPIRGIESTMARRALVAAGRPIIYPFVGDEKVSGYLFDKWNDQTYQKELERFVNSFTRLGREFITVFAEDDPVVPKESATVKGAREIRLTVGKVDFLKSLEAHGRPLKDKRVVDLITKR